MKRRSPAELHADAVEALGEALAQLGLQTLREVPNADVVADVVIDSSDGPIRLEVKAASVADPSRIRSSVEAWAAARRPGTHPILVADYVPDETRALLRAHGWGYLDRRGALYLRVDHLWINDTTLEPVQRELSAPGSPIGGRVGLGVALCLLMEPHAGHGGRELARRVNASPSTVHAAVKRLQHHALVDGRLRPLVPELFEVVAAEWRPQRIPVSREPDPTDNRVLGVLPPDGVGEWVVGGDVAAAAWGAPVVIGSGAPPDFYVPSTAIMRRAIRQLGETGFEQRRAAVAVAPTPIATAQAFQPHSWATPWLHWSIAHPVVVALDLAQDRSRGREIIDDWTPEGFDRVW